MNHGTSRKGIAILGQTATGKSSLAIEIAQKINAEIISVDSVLVYKKLNIGSAKPDTAEMKGIRHHLVDIVDPDYEFTASDYAEKASEAWNDIVSRGKTPIICGGTFFYYNAFKYGLWNIPPVSAEIREKWNHIFDEKGSEKMHEHLSEIDPETAEDVFPNDRYRIQRAIEIFEHTGQKRSDIKKNFECNKKPRFDAMEFSMILERDVLKDNITARTDKMIRDGFIEEVKTLLNEGYTRELKSMRSIGYREMVSHVLDGITLPRTTGSIIHNTMLLAKHQKTWTRKQKSMVILDPVRPVHDLVEEVLSAWKQQSPK